eukprot:scaffold255608_cov33-Tisochrysis_lutea.AAC.3
MGRNRRVRQRRRRLGKCKACRRPYSCGKSSAGTWSAERRGSRQLRDAVARRAAGDAASRAALAHPSSPSVAATAQQHRRRGRSARAKSQLPISRALARELHMRLRLRLAARLRRLMMCQEKKEDRQRIGRCTPTAALPLPRNMMSTARLRSDEAIVKPDTSRPRFQHA